MVNDNPFKRVHGPRTKPGELVESKETPKFIKIIKVPPSSIFPDYIREEWVGCEIPLARFDGEARSTFGGAKNEGGYEVLFQDAVNAMYMKYEKLERELTDLCDNPEGKDLDDEESILATELNNKINRIFAVLPVLRNSPFPGSTRLVFERDCCELIE